MTTKSSTEYIGQNLEGQTFNGQPLKGLTFKQCDLRSTNFTNANLEKAVFTECVFGISPFKRALLFIISILLSFGSGYIAMLSGTTLQSLLRSPDEYLKIAGYIIAGICIITIGTAIKMGLTKASLRIFIILLSIVIAFGLCASITNAGAAGVGAMYGIVVLLLLLVMFVVGSCGRAVAGTLGSTIIFIVVAMGGGMFGKSLGGGIGTVIMAISSAIISKKAIGSKENSLLKSIALYMSTMFGTSFKGANLSGVTFSNSKIKNTNFEHAKMDGIILENTEEAFCYYGKGETFPVKTDNGL